RVHELLFCEHGAPPQTPEARSREARPCPASHSSQDRAGNGRTRARRLARGGADLEGPSSRRGRRRVHRRLRNEALKRVILDTNIYIDWLNSKLHERLVLGPGYVRFLSTIVLMELWVGATTPRARRAVASSERAYGAAQRLAHPG